MMRACAPCRSRKVRCDSARPCSNCVIAKHQCSDDPVIPRKRKLPEATGQGSHSPAGPTARASTTVANGHVYDNDESRSPRVSDPISPTRTDDSADHHDLPSISLVDTDTRLLAGDSALHDHSVVARDFLVEQIEAQDSIFPRERMTAALRSLKAMVKATGREQSLKPSDSQIKGSQLLYDLQLPPSDLVLQLLRLSQNHETFTFSPPLSYISRDDFSPLCQAIFFRIRDYPASTAVIVHGIVSYLLQEYRSTAPDAAAQRRIDDALRLSRENFETSVLQLDPWLPLTLESVQAVLLAATFYMESSRSTMCKRLTMQGCAMVQMLNWHRKSSYKTDSVPLRHQKLLIFWRFYLIDRSLCLRLGQAPFFNDWDIDLPFPGYPDPKSFNPPFGPMAVTTRISRMMGMIYEHLFSPKALRGFDETRRAAFKRLQTQMHEVAAINLEPIHQSNKERTKFLDGAIDLVKRNDEITHHALLCMLYRAAPTYSQQIQDCIESARAAIDCHLRSAEAFSKLPELWLVYLHWTLLSLPFVPFTTLFTHVIKTGNRPDLVRLQSFAVTMSHCEQNQPAYKVARMASVLVSVAKVFVESKQDSLATTTSNARLRSEPPTPAPQARPADSAQRLSEADYSLLAPPTSAPAWAPFNPFLHALGIADLTSTTRPHRPSSVDSTTSSPAETRLETWFNGNQQMMAMLDDDFGPFDGLLLGTSPA